MLNAPHHDLERLLAAVGPVTLEEVDPTADHARPLRTPAARMLEAGGADVSTTRPATVVATVDGIQQARVLIRRRGRPLVLAHTAAASVGSDLAATIIDERLHLLASEHDADWLTSRTNASPPIIRLPTTEPWTFMADTAGVVAARRQAAERLVVRRTLHRLHDAEAIVLVDGNLAGHPHDRRLVGVVKTTATRYLQDEHALITLRYGWRSARFAVDGRFACYLRLRPHSTQAWDHGLVRLECSDATQLDAAAAACLLRRQTAASGDPRWDRHLTSVADVERLLRARMPAVFSLRA